MNALGNSLTLQDAAGLIAAGPASAIGIALNAALTGTLTVTGIVDSTGSPVTWAISPGSTGFQGAPGSASSGGGQVWFSLSNVGADAAKAVAFWRPSAH